MYEGTVIVAELLGTSYSDQRGPAPCSLLIVFHFLASHVGLNLSKTKVKKVSGMKKISA